MNLKYLKKSNLVFIIILLAILITGIFPSNNSIQISSSDEGSQIYNINIKDVTNNQITKNFSGQHDNSYVIPLSDIDDTNILEITTNSKPYNIDILSNHFPIYSFDMDTLIDTYCKVETIYPDNDYFKDYTLEEALQDYSQTNYLLLIVGNDDSSSSFTSSELEAFQKIGLSISPLDYGFRSSFVAAINNQQIIYESSSTSSIDYTFTQDEHTIHLISNGDILATNVQSVIEIDNLNYIIPNRGVNIVVYDTKNNQLVDDISFDTYSSSLFTRNTDYFKSESTYSYSSFFKNYVATISYVKRLLRLCCSILLAILFIVLWFSVKQLYHLIKTGSSYKKRNILIIHIALSLFALFAFLLPTGYDYLCDKFSNVTISQLVYHLHTNLGGTNWSDFKDIFITIGIKFLIVLLLSILSFLLISSLRIVKNKRKGIAITFFLRWSTFSACMILIISILAQFSTSYYAFDYLVSSTLNSSLYEDYYASAKETSIIFPDKPKNLIYIFMESMEITDSNTNSGGAEKQNYIPELTQLALDNDCFNGNSHKLNGGLPLGNTKWTVAAMVGQTSGTPLNTPFGGNDYNTTKFLPGLYSIGDLLQDQGYHNCLLIGSDAAFGNRKGYFSLHGNYECCDYNWAIEENLIPSDYYEWWGFEDNKLYNFAKDKLTELAASSQPFNLTILTADTHFTDGYLCEDCDNIFDSQYANVLACSSKKTAEFVNWIQEQDFAEDTVIVIAGDHLYMDDSFYANISNDYDRKTYVCFINSSKTEPTRERTFSTIDLFPTTLSALGCSIEGNRLGLGTDLYSDEDTLAEQLGIDSLEYQLYLNSKYYKTNILYSK